MKRTLRWDGMRTSCVERRRLAPSSSLWWWPSRMSSRNSDRRDYSSSSTRAIDCRTRRPRTGGSSVLHHGHGIPAPSQPSWPDGFVGCLSQIGEELPGGENLISGQTLKKALEEVSKVRLQQTMFAEFPSVRPFILRLKGAKTQQSIQSLQEIWKEEPNVVADVAQSLVDVGFFERRGSRDVPDLWVPFLYRDALEMSQGAAE